MNSLIVAMTENGVIGRDGDMPWRNSADLRRFKRLTMGHHLVMGRKTYESIGRPLPGRVTVVLSRTADFEDPQIKVARSWPDAVAQCAGDSEVFVAGGAEIFRLALPDVERIYLTRLHVELEGDTHFPDVDWSHWKLREETSHAADEKNQYAYSFLTYDRKNEHA